MSETPRTAQTSGGAGTQPSRCALPVLCLAFLAGAAHADDWPTYRHDARRSGVSESELELPLTQHWVRRSPVPPMTAWPGPAKWDAFAGNEGLQSMRNFDPAFFVTVAGDAMYFGSSVDHAVHCLDVASGGERWVAFAGGAVRLPPTIHDGRAYFGADDGFAYCVDAGSGRRIWRFRPAASARLIPSDGKLISPWPVRTGVLVRDGRAYFGASLVPWETSYLCALDAVRGEPVFVTEHAGVTLQGAMLASTADLYVPQGRSVPLRFSVKDGAKTASIGGMGGTFCLLTEDERLVAMPNNQKAGDDVIQIGDPSGKAAMLRFAGADRLLVAGAIAYLHQGGKLRAFDRGAHGRASDEVARIAARLQEGSKRLGELKKRAAEPGAREQIAALGEELRELKAAKASAEKAQKIRFLWEVEAATPFDLIMAGSTLVVGGDGTVAVFDAATGRELWSAGVEGKAFGLASAGGRLFVSTSLGHIYCFGKSL